MQPENKPVLQPPAQVILAENVRVHAAEAAAYDSLHSEIFNRSEQRQLEADLDLLAAGCTAAVDLGAGTGNVSLKLAARGLRVTAVDLSPEMLRALEAKASGRISTVTSDVDSFLASVDALPELVTMSSVLHHLPDPWRTLGWICDLLPRDGVLYMTHEPTGLPPALHERALDLADRMLWTLIHPRLARRARSVDYSVSDHHAREGFAPDQLGCFLRQHNMEVEFVRTYGRSKFAALARLSIILGGRTELAVAARRR